MNVLIVGSGGREQAMAWKLLLSSRVTQIFMTSYNAKLPLPITPAAVGEQDGAGIVTFVRQNKIDLVVIGGEAALAAGVSDALQAAGILVFGPSQEAAQIETSKAFAKAFMVRHNIPTARYATFTSFAAALEYLHSLDYPIVIKASGLAAGKGVFLPDSTVEAKTILRNLLQEKILKEAGSEVIIEERLQGEEVSLLAFTDGVTVKAMPLARDHKRLLEGDHGPNTGGMGAFAPVAIPDLTPEKLVKTILQPTINGMRAEGTPFVGVIYAGLMLTANGPKVLEFNCRFGDPETQVLLPLLASEFLDVIQACVDHDLVNCEVAWHPKTAACVVLASEEYPAQSKTGHRISGLEKNTANSLVFQAATRLNNNEVLTNGGRVLTISGFGDNLTEALQAAYDRIATIHFTGMQYRRDIGSTAQKQDRKTPFRVPSPLAGEGQEGG